MQAIDPFAYDGIRCPKLRPAAVMLLRRPVQNRREEAARLARVGVRRCLYCRIQMPEYKPLPAGHLSRTFVAQDTATATSIPSPVSFLSITITITINVQGSAHSFPINAQGPAGHLPIKKQRRHRASLYAADHRTRHDLASRCLVCLHPSSPTFGFLTWTTTLTQPAPAPAPAHNFSVGPL